MTSWPASGCYPCAPQSSLHTVIKARRAFCSKLPKDIPCHSEKSHSPLLGHRAPLFLHCVGHSPIRASFCCPLRLEDSSPVTCVASSQVSSPRWDLHWLPYPKPYALRWSTSYLSSSFSPEHLLLMYHILNKFVSFIDCLSLPPKI